MSPPPLAEGEKDSGDSASGAEETEAAPVLAEALRVYIPRASLRYLFCRGGYGAQYHGQIDKNPVLSQWLTISYSYCERLVRRDNSLTTHINTNEQLSNVCYSTKRTTTLRMNKH